MTTPIGENSGDREEEVVEITVDIWKRELPETIMDFTRKPISCEEKFKNYDGEIEELAGKTDWNEKVIEGLRVNKDANNFWMMFSSHDADCAVLGGEGMIGTYGYKPFYLNSKYDNAWSRMCEHLPDDAKMAIGYADRRYEKREGGKTDEEKEAISKLALYLSENEKVLASFLWR